MSTTTGIDLGEGGVHLAVVDNGAGRPRIELLRSGTLASVREGLAASDRVRLAVRDSDAIVKRLRLPSGRAEEREDRLVFELTQALLDDGDDFRFLLQPTGDPERVIGAAVRKSLLPVLPEGSGLLAEGVVTHRLRSVAVGQGYLGFCRRAEGTLMAVTEVGPRDAVVSLVAQDQIVDVAALRHRCDDLSVRDQQERLAIDIKTVVNFRLAALLDQGLSQPLAGMVLWGDGVDDACRETVQAYFPVGVSLPTVNAGYLAAEVAAEIPAEALPGYLVALGLAVN